MDDSPPSSSDHGISLAKILECVAVSSSGDFPNPRIRPLSLTLASRLFTTGTTLGMPLNPVGPTSPSSWCCAADVGQTCNGYELTVPRPCLVCVPLSSYPRLAVRQQWESFSTATCTTRTSGAWKLVDKWRSLFILDWQFWISLRAFCRVMHQSPTVMLSSVMHPWICFCFFSVSLSLSFISAL